MCPCRPRSMACLLTPSLCVSQDMVIFMGLLNDLFPGVDPPRKRDVDFEKVISEVTAEMKLTVEADFVLRVVQLSELLAIRHCVFLMGPTGSGRTEVYKVNVVLAAAGQQSILRQALDGDHTSVSWVAFLCSC